MRRGVNREQGDSRATRNVLRELIIPEIEREVNQGKNFAPLRQIYHSLILAKWYKQNIKDSILTKVYTDQNKVEGIVGAGEEEKMAIYDRYMEAYRKGVFSFIKEDYDALSQTVIPKKYFSGGISDSDAAILVVPTDNSAMVMAAKDGPEYRARVSIAPEFASQADASRLDGALSEKGVVIKQWISDFINQTIYAENFLGKYNGIIDPDKIARIAKHVEERFRSGDKYLGKYYLQKEKDIFDGNVEEFNSLSFEFYKEDHEINVKLGNYIDDPTDSPSPLPDLHIRKFTIPIPSFKSLDRIRNLLNDNDGKTRKVLFETSYNIESDWYNLYRYHSKNSKMLRSYVNIESLRKGKPGTFIALDFGGSNLRTAIVEIASQGEVRVVKQNVMKFTDGHRKTTKDLLFGMVAEQVKGILDEVKHEVGKKIPLVLIFSHPMKQNGLNEAIVVEWSKEFEVHDVVGHNIADILQDALNQNQSDNVRVAAVVNDIVATHAADPNAASSLILGTGYNISLINREGEIINIHPSSFQHVDYDLITEWDIEFLKKNKSKFSNLTSGRKIAEIMRRMMIDLLKNPIFIERISQPDNFSIVIAGEIDNSDDIRSVLYKYYGIERQSISNEDISIIRDVVRIVTKRAGYMVAASVVKAVDVQIKNHSYKKNSDDLELKVIVDGSVYEKHPTYKRYIEEGINILLERSPRVHIKLEFIKDAFIIGAARIAAIETKNEEQFPISKRGDSSTLSNVGGIDMNDIEVDRQGSGVDIQFDPVAIENLQNIQGFTPVIINLTPITSVLPLLGLAPREEDEGELVSVQEAVI